ncbi:unnamed protein product [Darwinula stevensoni]|uniref:Uncharacterized protein n=1 Tax=Darwinula stevensoni TaxID=69355 RepID=A0A7R8X4X6_9CRUS|nr:unnamed protein product [Darwinula stevensoni]CAG0880236.1 unnamed protein product [Darwinula stevensoni]
MPETDRQNLRRSLAPEVGSLVALACALKIKDGLDDALEFFHEYFWLTRSFAPPPTNPSEIDIRGLPKDTYLSMKTALVESLGIAKFALIVGGCAAFLGAWGLLTVCVESKRLFHFYTIGASVLILLQMTTSGCVLYDSIGLQRQSNEVLEELESTNQCDGAMYRSCAPHRNFCKAVISKIVDLQAILGGFLLAWVFLEVSSVRKDVPF